MPSYEYEKLIIRLGSNYNLTVSGIEFFELKRAKLIYITKSKIIKHPGRSTYLLTVGRLMPGLFGRCSGYCCGETVKLLILKRFQEYVSEEVARQLRSVLGEMIKNMGKD